MNMFAFLPRVRAQLGQAAWVAKRFPPSRLRRQWNVITHMGPSGLKPGRARHSVWGITVVRDEADVLGLTMRHLLDQGVDHILVADNGSKDGTRELLAELARRDPRVTVVDDATRAHHQSEKMTWLAHLAWRAGASWLVPFDADEFWFADGMGLAEFLRSQDREVSIVHADFHHMVPSSPAADLRTAEFILDATPSFPGKVAVRTHPLLEIWPGNHSASRVGGQVRGLHIAHAQYRTPAQVARKVRQGAQAAALTGEDLSWFSPHWVAGAGLTDDDIDDVFTRISRGEPDERIGYAAAGPMVRVQPLLWPVWDPEGQVPGVIGRGTTPNVSA